MAYQLTAVTIRTDNSEQGMAQINALWSDVKNGTLPLLRDSEGRPDPQRFPVARYSGYENGPAGRYDLSILCVTAEFLQMLEAMASAGQYRTYEVRDAGGLAQCVQRAWAQVWGDQAIRRSFNADYEISIPAAYAADGMDCCRLYIAVQQER